MTWMVVKNNLYYIITVITVCGFIDNSCFSSRHKWFWFKPMFLSLITYENGMKSFIDFTIDESFVVFQGVALNSSKWWVNGNFHYNHHQAQFTFIRSAISLGLFNILKQMLRKAQILTLSYPLRRFLLSASLVLLRNTCEIEIMVWKLFRLVWLAGATGQWWILLSLSRSSVHKLGERRVKIPRENWPREMINLLHLPLTVVSCSIANYPNYSKASLVSFYIKSSANKVGNAVFVQVLQVKCCEPNSENETLRKIKAWTWQWWATPSFSVNCQWSWLRVWRSK